MDEYAQYHTIYGVAVQPAGPTQYAHDFMRIEMPFGPAAGPHTQLAQNIAAAYAGGARFFELKTVQPIDGTDLVVNKPCISVPDECYNIEWSTELTVQEAFEEYVKAYFLLAFMAVEFQLGRIDGFSFNMSVGYDLKGIQSEKINTFIDHMIHAETTTIYQQCKSYLEQHMEQFTYFTPSYLQQIGGQIAESLTVSTMHGCPANEIEQIASYLIQDKKIPLYIKLNPTLLGYDTVQQILRKKGYGYMQLNEQQFAEDLHVEDAVPMLKRLQQEAEQRHQFFGIKLTNTLPVKSQGLLPDEFMYVSGKPLFLLAIHVAAKLSDACRNIPISFSGGLDEHNLLAMLKTGIFPLTMTTTVLKAHGYACFSRFSKIFAVKPKYPMVPDSKAIAALAEQAMTDAYYQKKDKKSHVKTEKLPLVNCRACGLCVAVCPNRANRMLPKMGMMSEKRQIVHIDAYCNECGNCAGFCPYDGKPYRDKFTIFKTMEEFLSSPAMGICHDNGAQHVRFPDTLDDADENELYALMKKLAHDSHEI